MAHFNRSNFDAEKFLNSLVSAISPEREIQKLFFRKAKDYLDNNSFVHLDSFLKALYSDYEAIKPKLIFSELGVTSGIVAELSLVYNQEPDREFLINGEEVRDKDKILLESIYELIGNSKFQMYEKLVNAMSTCSILVEWSEETNMIRLRYLTPDKYDIIQDEMDLTKVTAFYYQIDSVDDMTNKQNATTFVYYDKDRFSKVTTGSTWKANQVVNDTALGELKTSGFRDENEDNIYKIIPIVTTTSEEQVNKFFVDKNARVFVTNEEKIIIKDISSNDTSFLQGHSQLVHTRNKSGAMNDKNDVYIIGVAVKVDLDNGMHGGELPEKMEYISPNVNLGQLNQDTKESFLQTASIMGLGESDGNVKANASGISLMISDEKKNKIINGKRSTYISFEKQLFDIIRIVYNVHNKNAISDKIEIKPNFKEIVTIVSEVDRIDIEQHDIDNDLRTKYQILMDRDPELDEKRAKEKVLEAEKASAESRKIIFDMENPNNIESD